MSYEVQVGTCNGLPIVVNATPENVHRRLFKKVRLLHDFHKDAPVSYRPAAFMNEVGLRNNPYLPPAWHPAWGFDKADWLYPYLDFECEALVAAGVAVYYVGSLYPGMGGVPWPG